MKLNPKIFFGMLAFFFILTLSVVIIFNLPKTQTSTAQITINQENFKFSLGISKQDENAFEDFLSNFNINRKFREYEFQAGSTASAALAFATPVKADLKISPKQIEINGNTDSNQKEIGPYDQITLPELTPIAICAQDLTYFLKLKLNLKNQAIFNEIPNKQYLIILSEKDYILGFNSKNDEFQKIIELLKQEKDYVEENDENTTFHLFKDQNSQTSTLILFQNSGTSYIASSKEAAKELTAATGKKFPENQNEDFNFEYTDINNEEASSTILQLFHITNIQLSEEALKKYISKIKKASFSLNGRTFSGLISLK